MANTTWNPADKAAGITLSGLNLVATNNNNALSAVRAIDRKLTGKSYWEVIFNTITFSADAAGITDVAMSLTGTGLSQAIGNHIIGIMQTGACSGGLVSPFSLGTITAGTAICFAVDLTAQLFWARAGAAGLWNASASANPATGTGGISLVPLGLGAGVAVYPWMVVGNTNDRMTANFGDTAFVGATPVGFTAGFTSGATPPLNMLDTQAAVEDWRTPANPDMRATQVAVEDWREPIPDAQVTQVLAEHWYSNTNPDIQVTQVVLEHWATAASSTVQAIATQVLLEHWATVASVVVPPPASGGPIVTMIH